MLSHAWRLLLLAFVFTATNAMGCDATTRQPAPPSLPHRVLGVTVSPNQATIVVGGQITLVPDVSVENNPNQPALVRTVTWSTSAPAVATISSTGVVIGVSRGTAVITATSVADTTKQGTAVIIVQPAPSPGALRQE
jgi:uncharacterized protein YjdB